MWKVNLIESSNPDWIDLSKIGIMLVNLNCSESLINKTPSYKDLLTKMLLRSDSLLGNRGQDFQSHSAIPLSWGKEAMKSISFKSFYHLVWIPGRATSLHSY